MLWRSTQDPETKQSNSKAPRSSPATIEGTAGASVTGQVSVPRPGGRTPHDSIGFPMQWDHAEGIWRSVNIPDEAKQSSARVVKLTASPAALSARSYQEKLGH